ncbi:MAG TPA: hypothetical protein VLT45_28955 [Kofleriaceae bacterium]|nr:hypothetical protein [Kofleriaceae bacterium]
MRLELVASSTSADLLGVCGLDERSAIAVARGGTVLRWSSGAWHREHAGTSEDLYDVRGA